VVFFSGLVESNVSVLDCVSLGGPDGLVLSLVSKDGVVSGSVSLLEEGLLILAEAVIHLAIARLVLQLLHLRAPELNLLLLRILAI